MSKRLPTLIYCGMLLLFSSCASRRDQSASAITGSLQQPELASDNNVISQIDDEPLPTAEISPQELDQLTPQFFDYARPSQPRNPYDSWEYRQYRRIVPPAQR